MARKLRVEFPGAIYHITHRGNGRMNIFKDDHDRERLLLRLSESADTYNVRVYMFCFMSNHIHIVCETPLGNISRFMQSLATGYTVYYNLKNNHSGHLFQGRFGAKLVEGDSYLLSLTRYVHLNPVYISSARKLPLAQRLNRLNSYRWSSYGGYVDQSRICDFIEYGPVLAMMDEQGMDVARRKYREFVESGIVQSDAEFIKIKDASPLSIGSLDFDSGIRRLYKSLVAESREPRDVAFREQKKYLSSDIVLDEVCREFGVDIEYIYRRQRGSMIRPVTAYLLCKFTGMNQRAVAKELKLTSGAAVGSQCRKILTVVTKDDALKIQVDSIVERLTKVQLS